MAGILGDIDKTARAGAGCAEPCGIDVPVRVHLAGAHKGDVDPCAVVVEHLILVANHRAQITADTKIHATRLLPTVDPRLDGDGDLLAELFLVNDGANHVIGNTGAEIDDAAGVR